MNSPVALIGAKVEGITDSSKPTPPDGGAKTDPLPAKGELSARRVHSDSNGGNCGGSRVSAGGPLTGGHLGAGFKGRLLGQSIERLVWLAGGFGVRDSWGRRMAINLRCRTTLGPWTSSGADGSDDGWTGRIGLQKGFVY